MVQSRSRLSTQWPCARTVRTDCRRSRGLGLSPCENTARARCSEVIVPSSASSTTCLIVWASGHCVSTKNRDNQKDRREHTDELQPVAPDSGTMMPTHVLEHSSADGMVCISTYQPFYFFHRSRNWSFSTTQHCSVVLLF